MLVVVENRDREIFLKPFYYLRTFGDSISSIFTAPNTGCIAFTNLIISSLSLVSIHNERH